MDSKLINTEQQSSPATQQLRTKLRSLINLTRTVSGINNAGRPNLRKSPIWNKTRFSLKSFKAVDDMLLNATATILVRDQEVVASGGSAIAVEGQPMETAAGEPLPASQEQHVSAAESDFDGGGDSNNLSFRISRIAGVINPRKEDDDYRSHFMVLDGGKSHHREIRDDNKAWEWFLNVSKEDPLPNHILTVVHYLEKHKRLPEDFKRIHQDYFSKYLVARCWPKMYRRIDSWSSKGFIFELGRIPEKYLKDEVSVRAGEISTAFADRSNRELAATVVAMVRDGKMESVIMLPSGHPEWDLTPLVTSFGGMNQDAPQHENSGTYDVTICFEFHRLLIATLLAYGRALKSLNKGKRMEDRVKACKHVWVCGSLLSKIASSRMLRQHLTACRRLVYIPIYDYHKEYQSYIDSPMEDSNSSANTDNPDSAVEDIDLEGDETVDEVFLKWVRLQASYWLDLSLLSRTSGSSNPAHPVPEVFLVAVKDPRHGIDSFPVESLETTLKDLVSSNLRHPINIKEVLAIIDKKGGEEHVYPGTVHCEIALAVLILLARNLSATGIKKFDLIAGLLQNANDTIIMSKLCCPSCWELVDILRDGTKRFKVRGRHPTLFPVELPAYLSPQVLREMITRFEEFLYDGILVMMRSQERTCPPSRQSVSYSSTGSPLEGISMFSFPLTFYDSDEED